MCKLKENDCPDKVAKLQKEFEGLKADFEVLKSLVVNAKEVLNFAEAAAFLGLSKSTLYKMTHAHAIPFYKPNNKLVFFERSELMAWLRRGRVASEEEIESEARQVLQRLAAC